MIFLNPANLFQDFFSLPVSEPNHERDCKDNRLSVNLQKLFQEPRISLKISNKTISSSFIVNSRLICKNRCFSNADAKVATFSESASVRSSFFVKNFIISQQRGLYIYIIYKVRHRTLVHSFSLQSPHLPHTIRSRTPAGMPHNIPARAPGERQHWSSSVRLTFHDASGSRRAARKQRIDGTISARRPENPDFLLLLCDIPNYTR